MDIQILRDGKQTGPYTEEAVHALLKEGSVLVHDLAWRPGLSEWVPLVNVLYPAATRPPSAAAPAETPAPAAATREPATARQKAFLDYVGIAFAPDATKDAAAQLVNEALENPRDPARLARWNEERLQLHPALFAAEIQARKENRPQRFLEICHEEGAPFFEKVTKAHCQVLVAHLDVHFPNWDARERAAAAQYFFPALAEKFPQLLTDQGRAKFKTAEKSPAAAWHPKSAPVAGKARPATGSRVGKVIYAMARGVFVGLFILGLLWIGRGAFAGKTPPAKKSTAPPAAEEAATAPEIKPEPAPPAEKPAASVTAASVTAASVTAASVTAASVTAAAPEIAAPEPALAEPKSSAAKSDLPSMSDAPAAAPAASLIPPSTARTSVLLTKPVQITLPFGKISIPPGTTVKIVSQNGSALTVRYLDHVVTIPASSTDLGTDPAAPPQ